MQDESGSAYAVNYMPGRWRQRGGKTCSSQRGQRQGRGERGMEAQHKEKRQNQTKNENTTETKRNQTMETLNGMNGWVKNKYMNK